MEDIQTHTHDGINSQKIKTRDVIPTYKLTATQLSAYLARQAIDGEEFNNFDGTNYRKYIRINGLWKYGSLT
jgi:hypothetical protein